MSEPRHKIKGLKLYQSITVLVFIIMLISVIANSLLLTKQMGSIVNLRLGANAKKVSTAISHNQDIIKALSNEPVNEQVINKAIMPLSEATNSSIIIFNANEQIVGIYNSSNDSLLKSGKQTPNTLTQMRKLPADIFKSNNVEKLYDKDKTVIGYIIVGFADNVGNDLSKDAVELIQFVGIIGLAIGLLGSLLLAKRIKENLSGYEPKEISQILLERDVLLDTVGEGIIALDINMNIYQLNKKARDILTKAGFPKEANWVNKPCSDIFADTILQKALAEHNTLENQQVKIHDLQVFINLTPMESSSGVTGALITLNEQNTVEEMAKRLSGVTNYADALRAQTHEFMNKMHVIKGLIYTNNQKELQKYITDITETSGEEMEEIESKIHNSILAAFLLGKKSRAQEKMVDFSLTEESNFPEELTQQIDVHELIVIIGNLLENAFDILQSKKDDRLVNLSILPYEDELIIQVENNGAPIEKDAIDKIFVKGYTTKGFGHGYGLALLKQHLDRLNGSIQVESDELNGTEFTIEIPLKEEKKHD